MKHYHVVLITLIAGVMLGAAVPAKAANPAGVYVCGNTGLSVNIEVAAESSVFKNEIIHKAIFSLFDEGGNAKASGVNWVNLATGRVWGRLNKPHLILDSDPQTIHVSEGKNEYICARAVE